MQRGEIACVPHSHLIAKDPRKAQKDVYMFSAIQSTSGATIALTNDTYNYVKKVCRVVSWNVELIGWSVWCRWRM